MEQKNRENSVYCVEYGNGNVASPVMQAGSDKILKSTFTYKMVSQRATTLIAIFILLILAGGSALAWYFLEYRVWVLEVRVEQQYIGQISILNRNFSTALSLHTSRVFREEARIVEAMVRTYFQFHSRIKPIPGNLHHIRFQFRPFFIRIVQADPVN